ncbi:MAG: pilin [Patescibacteria group bacterium]|nr:pilin [Patescibacteria group bacterium]
MSYLFLTLPGFPARPQDWWWNRGRDTVSITSPTGLKQNQIGDIVSEFIPIIFALAGIVLLVYLIIGGFKFITSGGDQKALQSAKNTISNAVLGFILVFVSFWLLQIISTIFNVGVGL